MASISILPATDPPIPVSGSSGSPRIITNENGVVTSRKDFMAYGEEAASANRVSGSGGNGYDPAGTRKDYTGYEKDAESGLEFAQARYYNPIHGRYTSVDPLVASADVKNPQTFNRYSYVLNSPYKFIDPLGLLSSQAGTSSFGYCGASNDRCEGDYQWGNGGGGDGPPIITLQLRIVYAEKDFKDESEARSYLKATVEDLMNVYGQLNIEFKISYQSGTATEEDGQGAYWRIATGALEGIINAFVYKNKNEHKDISWYNPTSKQIFIRQGGFTNSKDYGLDPGALAHEVGHLLRGDTQSGTTIFGYDTKNITNDAAINSANAQLRSGRVIYGRDWKDDYRSVKPKITVIPQLLNKLGPRAATRTEKYSPTVYDLYRVGAMIVAAQ